MNRITSFRSIKKFSHASYRVDVPLVYLKKHLALLSEGATLDMNPPYQRGYVWTRQQKIEYLEFLLKGGFTGRDIFWNSPGWPTPIEGRSVIEIVDGKQRLDAALAFLEGYIPVFGSYIYEFTDTLDHVRDRFTFHINNLTDPVEVVEWYIGMNTGGSVHSVGDLYPAYQWLDELRKNR